MKIIDKLSKYKIADKFLKTAVAGMLLFTTLVSPAVSYQQAMTDTSENTYSIGEGVSATLNIQTASQQNVVYPNEFIEMEPIVKNTGASPIWTIVAVKIPSINNSYTGYYNLYNALINSSRSKYYPAFFPISRDESRIGKPLDYSWFISNAWDDDYVIDYIFDIEGYYDWGLSEDWTPLAVNKDYANQENGFYVIYLGYNTTLNTGDTPTSVPFAGFLSANFQETSYDVLPASILFDGEKKEADNYTCKEYNQNLGIEMRLFAIQSAGLYSIEDAWTKNKEKFSLFGNTSIVNTLTQTNYTAGRHEVVFDVTKDVQQIKIVNATTGKSETFNLVNGTNVTVSDADSNGICKAKIKVNFDATGIYEASVCADASGEFVSPVTLGEITVS